MEIEYKCVGVSGLKVLNEEDGIIETFVSVTGLQDNVKDVIHPGAYEKSLAARTPKGVWHHNWHESISRTEAIKELLPGSPELPTTLPDGSPWPADAGALKVKTRFNLETQRGREAYADVKFFGDQQEWSIGYNVPVGGATIDSKTGVRHIHVLDLYEYSPVLFGAMPAARTASVKDAQMAYKALNAEDFDAFLIESKSFLAELEEKAKKNPTVNAGDDEVEEDVPDGEEEETQPNKPVGAKPGHKADDEEEREYKGFVSAAQADAVQSAIDALQSILQVKAADDPNSTDASDADDADDGSVAFTEAVAIAFPGNDNLKSNAQDFDDAYDSDDGKAMEEAADPIMNAIEEAIEGGQDPASFHHITTYIVDAFDAVNDGHETEATETQENLAGDASASKGLGFHEDYDLDYQFKRAFSPKKREELAQSGHAMDDGSFPIENDEDLKNAVSSVGRAKDPAKAKAHIKKRAAALGKTDAIPSDWDGGKKDDDVVIEKKSIDLSDFADVLGSI